MELKRSVLVPYAAEAMFDLIEQAEHYPLFLPWCVGARILERSDDWVAARIEFKYLQVRFGFQTRNPKRRPEWLQVRLVEGPFKRFEGDWQLTPVGAHGCRIHFALNYEVSDGPLDKVAAKAAELVARSMLDAFVKRAQDTLPVLTTPPAVAVAPSAASIDATPSVASPEIPATPASATDTISPDSTPSETTMPQVDPALFEAVRACPLSQELSPEQAAVLASLMQMQSYAVREVVAPEGSVDNRLCVVVDGSLSVVKQLGGPEEALVNSLKPGDFAHELGFLDGSSRYASLVAAEPSRVLTLKRQDLESLVQTDPVILYRVMCAIVRTVHRIQTRLAVQSSELTNYIVKQHGRY